MDGLGARERVNSFRLSFSSVEKVYEDVQNKAKSLLSTKRYPNWGLKSKATGLQHHRLSQRPVQPSFGLAFLKVDWQKLFALYCARNCGQALL